MKTMIGIYRLRYAQKSHKMEFKIFQKWYRNHPRLWKAKDILNHFEKDFVQFLAVRRPPLFHEIPMKDVDKTALGKRSEIGVSGTDEMSGGYGKSGNLRRKRRFNIFWAASVGDRCRIRHL